MTEPADHPGPRVRRPLVAADLRGEAAVVAPRLLGRLLVRREPGLPDTVVRLVEVEAYREDDPASHSFRGRTPRTEPMFARPGTSYVYFTYGMHWCCNVAVEPSGIGAAVLLRAAAPVQGLDRLRARRGRGVRDRDLLRGPARLTQALAVDGALTGVDLLDAEAPLHLADDGYVVDGDDVVVTPRTGVTVAADVPWRFALRDCPWVLPHKRHPRAPRPDA